VESTVRKPPRSWLGPIRILLLVMLWGEVLLLPLLLVPFGPLPVGRVDSGDLFTAVPTPFSEAVGAYGIEVGLRTYGWGQHLLHATAHGLAYTVVTIPMLYSAVRLIDKVRATGPFTAEVVRRLRRLGAMVLVGGLLATVAAVVAGRVLLHIALPPGDPSIRAFATPDFEWSLWWLVLGFTVLAFSEVTKWASYLRADLDGVV
jgi:hypothetical protein